MHNQKKKPSRKRRSVKHIPFLAWYIFALPLALGFMVLEFFLAVG
jgi:hypothetical protein